MRRLIVSSGRKIVLQLDKIIMPESGLQFYNGVSNGDLFNIFHEQDYDFLPVKNRVVIDIGANIADSSIYFAMIGSKKVIIALEPFPKNFEVARKNITLNGFTDKIELLNAGCCGGLRAKTWYLMPQPMESVVNQCKAV